MSGLDIGKIRKNEILLALILIAAFIFRMIMMLSHSYTLDEHELMSIELSDGVNILSFLAFIF